MIQTTVGGLRAHNEISRITKAAKRTALRIKINNRNEKYLELYLHVGGWRFVTLQEAIAEAIKNGNLWKTWLTGHFPEAKLNYLKPEEKAAKTAQKAQKQAFATGKDGVTITHEIFSSDFQKQLQVTDKKELRFKFASAKFQILEPARARKLFSNDALFTAFLDKHFPAEK